MKGEAGLYAYPKLAFLSRPFNQPTVLKNFHITMFQAWLFIHDVNRSIVCIHFDLLAGFDLCRTLKGIHDHG